MDNFLKKYLTKRNITVVAILVLITLVAMCSDAKASTSNDLGPKWLSDFTPNKGFHFEVKGELWQCMRTEMGGSEVSCHTPRGPEYTCDYRDPPVYFVNCRKNSGI